MAKDSTAKPDKCNILLVDDQPAKLLSYEAILADLGENLIRAGSAREALHKLLETEVAVVLMDVSMPELDGFELAEIIRQHPRFRQTAIIFVSAVHLSELDQLKGYERGAVDYVSVPVQPPVLRAKVAVFVELYRKTHQLEEMNQELERRVTERTRELQQRAEELERLNGELRRSNRELDAFTYITSHDLKEPLRGIHSHAQFLLEDHADELAEPGREHLRVLQRLTRRMEGLIEALLRYSRLERQELERHEIGLQSLLDEALEVLAPRIRESGVEVRVPRSLPSYSVDRTLVVELLINLIANAIKYNDKPAMWVEIGYQEREPLAFYVRDNGIGIAEKHHESVFRIFKRLHGRDDWGGGTGVGLTIVRKIVERHGGRIWIESKPGEGTTLYFTLTRGHEPDGNAPAASQHPAG
ncbi:MAG: sensor histidine kinase [Myxococcota bacterium]